MPDGLSFLNATELKRLFLAKQLSPVEYATSLLTRIEQSEINAFCTVDPDSVMAASRQAEQRYLRGNIDPGSDALLGIPVSVKDNIETMGMRTTYGSRTFAHHIPTRDAIIVERVKSAGAVISGKTNLPEFATKGVTDSPLFGHTLNPWKTDRVVGGSTGGGAAAVAAGLGPLAIGNDQAGSIRMPAALCGVIGFKPTAGRVPFVPNLFPWDDIFHTGFIARSVDDIELIFGASEGFESSDPSSVPSSNPALRAEPVFGWSADIGFANIQTEVLEIDRGALKQFEQIGRVAELDINLEDALVAYERFVPIKRYIEQGEFVEEHQREMDPAVVDYILGAKAYGLNDLALAYRARQRVFERVEHAFLDHDFIVTPTLSVTAFEIGDVQPDRINGKRLKSFRDWFPFTFPFNFTGHPAISVPAGFDSEGLPVGIQIIGRRHSDFQLLNIAERFTRGWNLSDVHPKVF